MARFSRHPNTRKERGRPDPKKTKMEYRSHFIKAHGAGRNLGLTITVTFHDRAHPQTPKTYNYPAMVNAIKDRKSKRLETVDLEKWKNWAKKEYEKRGLTPPETPKQRRDRLKAFVNG